MPRARGRNELTFAKSCIRGTRASHFRKEILPVTFHLIHYPSRVFSISREIRRNENPLSLERRMPFHFSGRNRHVGADVVASRRIRRGGGDRRGKAIDRGGVSRDLSSSSFPIKRQSSLRREISSLLLPLPTGINFDLSSTRTILSGSPDRSACR